jgi:hypothetical protein
VSMWDGSQCVRRPGGADSACAALCIIRRVRNTSAHFCQLLI